MDNKSLPTKTEYFHKERLRELAKDPRNRVYEYEYDTVEDKMPSTECRNIMNEMRTYMKGMRRENADIATKVLRKKLRERNDRWKKFADEHPMIFSYITWPPRFFTHLPLNYEQFYNLILKLVYTVYLSENGHFKKADEEKNDVSEKLKSIFVREDVNAEQMDSIANEREELKETFERLIETEKEHEYGGIDKTNTE